jgi:hypothetical protein
VGELPWRVIFYSFPVANFVMAFTVSKWVIRCVCDFVLIF